MDKIYTDFLMGMLMAYVPIWILSYYFHNKSQIADINYSEFIISTPLIFGLINIIFLPIFRSLEINNFYLIGAIMSIVYSGIGRFYLNITDKVFQMNNPNMFHLYALVIWTVVYGIIGNIIYKKLC